MSVDEQKEEQTRPPGRPPGAKNKQQPGKRFTPTISIESLNWFVDKKKTRGLSYGKLINKLVVLAKRIEREEGDSFLS